MESCPKFVDVTQPPFNAAGDGTTDDSAAFQWAVDAVHGGEMVFPSDARHGVGADSRSDKYRSEFKEA
jgi:hypothetical protein